MVKRQRIFITGRVQGVGFRPAVYRLATQLGLTGFVYNDTRGVTIVVQGAGAAIDEFLNRLRSGEDKPAMAEIKSCEVIDIATVADEGQFVISASESAGTVVSEVAADIATCRDCLCEMAEPSDFRYRYPFINCTNCGPRYSIVQSIPYDRPNTTMSVFQMCDKCAAQYSQVTDRRFHAQPVACGQCGPKVWLADSSGQRIASGTEETITAAAKLLGDGKIVAIKGVGGFHLAVDALNDRAVQRLRERKKRDHKPFAMMVASIEKINTQAVVSDQAQKALSSPRCPIVLLPKRQDNSIAESVADGVDSFGFMLCYAPLHHMLFAQRRIEVLVMTSGNISDEPLICKNQRALDKLGEVADAFLMHDREIYRQVDDSIVHIVEGAEISMRRARGYVPSPILAEKACSQDILAAGSDLKNTFCFVKGNQFICSEHIGDLEDADVYRHYVDSIEHLRGLFEVEPKVIVCDLHPGYMSTHYALSKPGVRVIQVQHHWAHIASVLAENNMAGAVIGLECDGTGYGTDGAVWGCECMIASLTDFERFGHLAYYGLAGGDKASKEAVRPILGLLKKTYGDQLNLSDFDWLLDRIEPDREKQRIISEQLDKGVNTVVSSSLGRVFDAVAAMVGVGNYNYFEAQLPMGLESIIAGGVEDGYDFELTGEEPVQLDLSKMVVELLADIKAGQQMGVMSAKFHNCIATGLVEMAKAARKKSGLDTTALSGGVFCNRYLLTRAIKLLNNEGFSVLYNKEVPSNDGGISLGQAAIAAALLNSEGIG